MKKIIIISIIAIFVAGVFLILETPEEIENGEEVLPEREVEFVAEGDQEAQEIRVSEEGEEVFSINIDELNQWTIDNWDYFDEPPQVAMRDVEPGSFGFFDRAASISPDNQKLIFSVSDYAAATTTSILIVIDLETEEMEMMATPARGTVEDYVWDEDSSRVAYTLGTARAAGDFLRVDDLSAMDIVFELTEEDLLEIIDPDQEVIEMGQFMPVFDDLNWEAERLSFTTESLDSDDRTSWVIDQDGNNLELE